MIEKEINLDVSSEFSTRFKWINEELGWVEIKNLEILSIRYDNCLYVYYDRNLQKLDQIMKDQMLITPNDDIYIPFDFNGDDLAYKPTPFTHFIKKYARNDEILNLNITLGGIIINFHKDMLHVLHYFQQPIVNTSCPVVINDLSTKNSYTLRDLQKIYDVSNKNNKDDQGIIEI
jgi:hypothetical protein